MHLISMSLVSPTMAGNKTHCNATGVRYWFSCVGGDIWTAGSGAIYETAKKKRVEDPIVWLDGQVVAHSKAEA